MADLRAEALKIVEVMPVAELEKLMAYLEKSGMAAAMRQNPALFNNSELAKAQRTAMQLVEQIPLEKINPTIEALKFFVETKDPFWYEANQKHLRKSIAQFEEGKWQVHELIDD